MTNRRFAAIPLLIWLAGCTEPPQETQLAVARNPIAVRTVPVAFAEWPASYEATGTVRARTAAVISSRTMGYVREVKVQIGDRVKEGQQLVILDSRDLDVAIRRAEAAREEVKSSIPEADSGIAVAKANADLAQVTFGRMQELYSKKSISNQEFDEAAARLKSSQAAYGMARAKRAQIDARLAQAEQEVRAAEVSQSYGEIAAPFAGVVTSKPVEPGNMAIPGMPMMTIEREGAFRFEASVEESRMGAIRLGQAVTVKLDGSGGTITGKVSEIVPEVDAAARAGTVKIDLPAIPNLRSGTFARALFSSGTRRVMTIPAAAAMERGQLQSVLVADNSVARVRLVTLGAKTGDQWEVLSGLSEGEKVIVQGPPEVTDGTPVEVRP